MSNKVEIINEQEVLGKQFRVYGTWEEPLFLAKDVAEWIDYAKTGRGSYDVSRMLKTVDEDEKLIRTIFLSGQERNVWFLTENGLYEVLMLSRKPIAKQFKKKVKEILKEIRKKGSYTADTSALNILKNIVAQFEANNARMEAIEKSFNETREACADMYDQVDALQTKLDDTILKQPPKGSKTLVEVAKYLGLTSEDGNPHAQMAGAIARTCGIRTTITRQQDSTYSTTMVQVVGGVQQLVLYIKPAGIAMMRNWWDANRGIAYQAVIYKRRTVDKVTGEIHSPGDFRDCYYNIDGKKWRMDPEAIPYYGCPF